MKYSLKCMEESIRSFFFLMEAKFTHTFWDRPLPGICMCKEQLHMQTEYLSASLPDGSFLLSSLSFCYVQTNNCFEIAGANMMPVCKSFMV